MTTRCCRAFSLFLLALWLTACRSGGQPDARPGEFLLGAEPARRVVSIFPPASEILVALGAADAVAGVCVSDSSLPGLALTPLVGSAAAPDTARIVALAPGRVIAAPHQKEAIQALRARGITVITMEEGGIATAEGAIRTLGALVGREEEAETLIARERAFAALAGTKTAKLAHTPGHRPVRAIRLLAVDDDVLHVPGDDAAVNEIIHMAGGVAPRWGKTGQRVTITPDEWRAFAPEAIVFCGQEGATARQRLAAPAWAGVPALATGAVFSYPCELVDRAATHYGYAALWLSSDLYGSRYSEPAAQVTTDAILGRKSLTVPFAAVAAAEVLASRLFDMPAKTFVLRFTEPQTVLSTLGGWKSGVTAVGNHYTSPPSWSITHHLGLEKANARTLALLALSPRASSMLYTGADMDNLAYAEESSGGLRVGVIATAGVAGNAMRASVDEGRYVEPGTINIIIVTNRALTPAAMSRGVITATEAKTAALEDLDIRSTYTGAPATGTGTDNVIVVGGSGSPAAMTGGHTKLGELVAKAVYTAVREAVARQSHILPQRSIFQRLHERGLGLEALVGPNLAAALEHILLEPRYAGFLAGALALSDSHERGLVTDTGAFTTLCLVMAGEVAGKTVTALDPVVAEGAAPHLVREALNALATGLLQRHGK